MLRIHCFFKYNIATNMLQNLKQNIINNRERGVTH